jgi:pimeloyl-ACP methyl ester carboxylesterase
MKKKQDDLDVTGPAGVTFKMVDLDRVRLHCAEMAPPRGERAHPELVLLIHGFPEYWGSWRHQLRPLAEAGFHVVAPDMRGFHLSDKPREVQAYHLEQLTDDVAGLVRAYGYTRAHVVGHDWGGAVAWAFAMTHPEMLERLVVLNVPHPLVMVRAFRRFSQLRKSWYMFFFQLPVLPELVLGRNDHALVRRVFRRDRMPDDVIDTYVAALARPGALRGGLNYYRASFRAMARRRMPAPKRIDAPTLVIWGDDDQFFCNDVALPPMDWVPHARVETLRGATHWVQQDRPDEVNALLVEFLAGRTRARVASPGATAEAT